MENFETETSAPNSPKGRETGLVVRLFSTPPHIFGISPRLDRDYIATGYRPGAGEHQPEAFDDDSDLRPPLEEEALNLSRMLKKLPVLDKFPGFPVATAGNETPDLIPRHHHHHNRHHHSMPLPPPPTREMAQPQNHQRFSFEYGPPSPSPLTEESHPVAASTTDDDDDDDEQDRRWGGTPRRTRPNGGPPPPPMAVVPGPGRVERKNDGPTTVPRSPAANHSNIDKSTPKSYRKTYGHSRSRSSTPNTSAGSASELLFPTSDLRSPPSPEPLGSARSSSPLKWRTRTTTSSSSSSLSSSPVDEEEAPAAFNNSSSGSRRGGRATEAREMPVQQQGLLRPGGGGRASSKSAAAPAPAPAAAAASDYHYSNGSAFGDTKKNFLDVVGRGGGSETGDGAGDGGESSYYTPIERRESVESSSSSSTASSVARRTTAFKVFPAEEEEEEEEDKRGGMDNYHSTISAGLPPITAGSSGASTIAAGAVREFPRADLRVTPPRALNLLDPRSLIRGRGVYDGGGDDNNGGANGSEARDRHTGIGNGDISPSRYRSPPSPVSVVNPFQILFKDGVQVRDRSSSVASSSRDVSPPNTSPPSPARSSRSSKSSGLSADLSSEVRTGTPPLESSFRFVPGAASSSFKPEAQYQMEEHQNRQVAMAGTPANPEGEEEEENDNHWQKQRGWEALPIPLPSPSTAALRGGEQLEEQGGRPSPPQPYPRLSSEVESGEESSAKSPGDPVDDELDVGPKQGFFTDLRHSPSYGPRATLPIAKSEPVGRWPTAGSSPQDDFSMHSGYRPRSMSLPGTQMAKSLPPTPRDGFSLGRDGQQQRRKGECYLCHKGTRLTDKEPCLACDCKYCCNCVLAAMESMPEGRKCRTCIGRPVQEVKRPYIGKPSRLLSRLLSPQEVQQIMKAERECAANQLRPEQVYVNGKQLSPEELSFLQKCPNPPQKLKPGRYWYDTQSGLWGKEGERPDKLISPDMKLGGILQENASNGTTQVYMNNRELGKVEVKMLKLAGVHCPPPTHLWVEPDGSYQEVGMKNFKGNIWNKTSIRLLYPFFSLPTPGGSARYSPRESPKDIQDVYGDYAIQNKLHKILVLGHEGSGRSTLFKQTKFIFKDGFKHEERLEMKSLIRQHIYKYMGILLEGRERFEEEAEDLEQNERCRVAGNYAGDASISGSNVYALNNRLKEHARHITDLLAEESFDEQRPSGNSGELGPALEALWNSAAIQEVYRRKEELNNLPVAAGYFLEKALEITSRDYLPSDEDVLRAEGLAQGSGLAEVEFFLEDKLPHQDHDSSPSRFQLIKVGGNGLTEGCKWLDMFEDVHLVVFCVAISEYDQVLTDKDGVTRSKLRQKELFDSVLKHPTLGEKPMVLLLNKYDVFEDKICARIPLTTCEWFSDFRPVGAAQMPPTMQAQQGYTYVVHKYKELFQASGHKLFTFKLNAVERDKVVEAFHYLREILNWRDNSWDLFPEESSAYSTDLSSYSHHQLHAPHRHDGAFTIDR